MFGGYRRSLTDLWQSVSDRLTDCRQQVSASLFKLSSLEENVAQLIVWLQDAEQKMKRDSELQPTLEDKKAVLQNIKVMPLMFLMLYCHHSAFIVLGKST